jgi:hypothetical protein
MNVLGAIFFQKMLGGSDLPHEITDIIGNDLFGEESTQNGSNEFNCYSQLLLALQNETHSPELLEYKADLVEDIRDKIKGKVLHDCL